MEEDKQPVKPAQQKSFLEQLGEVMNDEKKLKGLVALISIVSMCLIILVVVIVMLVRSLT